MISSGSSVRDTVDRTNVLVTNQGQVPAGSVLDLNFPVTIPYNITNYTAIGRVTARYFLLVFYS